MHEDNLHKFIIDWDSLLLEMRKLPAPEIMEPLFRTQIQLHPWMKEDMNIYHRAMDDAPEKCYDWLHQRVKAVLDLHKLQKNQHSLKNADRERVTAATDRTRHKTTFCIAYARGKKCAKGERCPLLHVADQRHRPRSSSARPPSRSRVRSKPRA